MDEIIFDSIATTIRQWLDRKQPIEKESSDRVIQNIMTILIMSQKEGCGLALLEKMPTLKDSIHDAIVSAFIEILEESIIKDDGLRSLIKLTVKESVHEALIELKNKNLTDETM